MRVGTSMKSGAIAGGPRRQLGPRQVVEFQEDTKERLGLHMVHTTSVPSHPPQPVVGYRGGPSESTPTPGGSRTWPFYSLAGFLFLMID